MEGKRLTRAPVVKTREGNSSGPFDLALMFGLVVSLFGYLSLVFMNFGYYPSLSWVDQMFGYLYNHSLNLFLPYSGSSFGLHAAAYLGLFLVLFLILERKQGLRCAFRETVMLGAVMVLLTEAGILLTQPEFLTVHVIQAQEGTILSGFSNLDLLLLGTVALLVSLPWPRILTLPRLRHLESDS